MTIKNFIILGLACVTSLGVTCAAESQSISKGGLVVHCYLSNGRGDGIMLNAQGSDLTHLAGKYRGATGNVYLMPDNPSYLISSDISDEVTGSSAEFEPSVYERITLGTYLTLRTVQEVYKIDCRVAS